MEDRLNQIAERLRQVERELADPAVYSDQQRLKNLSREQKELTPVVETFTALQQTEQAIAEAREMLSDPELRELAQEELTRTKEQRERLAEELKRLLLPRDPNDEKSVVLEIRGGVGGEEGALFAADLLRMYTMYAERRGWQLEIVSQNVTELGGVKEVCATVEGDGAWSRLKFEAGTHRVQRVPETESGGRIQTSAATVAVMPEAEETELSIDPKDLQIDHQRPAMDVSGRAVGRDCLIRLLRGLRRLGLLRWFWGLRLGLHLRRRQLGRFPPGAGRHRRTQQHTQKQP